MSDFVTGLKCYLNVNLTTGFEIWGFPYSSREDFVLMPKISAQRHIAAEWTEFTWNGLSYSITYIAFIYFFEVTIYHKIMKTQWLYFLALLTHYHLAIPLVGSWQNWLVMCTLTISSDQTILCTQTVRQNFKTLCLRWPSMFWLPKGSGRTFLSLPLLGSWEKDVQLAAPVWALYNHPLGCQSSTPSNVRNVTCASSSLRSRQHSGI